LQKDLVICFDRTLNRDNVSHRESQKKEFAMKKYYQLTECLLRLIKVQIEKYTGLASIGVGPDAGINGFLVVDEVNELLQFASTLIGLMIKRKEDELTFRSILSQTQFYLDQEHLRGYAGWLIDENNIHNTEYKRLERYKADMAEIISSSMIVDKSKPQPTNPMQQQCEHDSHSIAFKITDLVIQLRGTPELELNESVAPKHALRILRKHAQDDGRYHQPKIYEEIERLHLQCSEYLSKSSLTTRTKPLSKEEASTIRNNHTKQFEDLLVQYQKCNSSSKLFSENPEWYDIAGRNQITPPTTPGVYSQGLFTNKTAIMFSIGAIAIAMLIYKLMITSVTNSHTHSLP
jgi:hypothetical protein